MRRYTIPALIMWLMSTFIVTTSQMFGGGLIRFNGQNRQPFASDSLFVSTMIREQVAVTTTTQVFRNFSNNASTATYGFALPATAMVTNLRWKINDNWFVASMKSTDTTLPAGGGTATMDSFAQLFGSTPFTFPFKDSVAAGAHITVELTYVELLPYGSGLVYYSYPMTRHPLQGNSIRVNEWSVDISSGRELLSVLAPSHTLTTVEESPTKVTMKGANLFSTTTTLDLRFGLRFDALTMNVLSTKPVNEDGYALMMAVPQTQTTGSDIMPKRFTFVIDHSGSMAGTKMEQAKEAAEYCIQHLNADDLFNVIQFDDRIESWRHDHVLATADNIRLASEYIRTISVRGGTEITKSLTQALSMHKADKYVNVIIFLTDGQAPIDHTHLKAVNVTETRIFVFGVGRDVNEKELTQIANDHYGAATYVTEVSSTASMVSDLFQRIKDPMIKNPKVSFSPDVVYDVYPSIIPDIYRGEQMVLVGRYTTPGENTVTVSGYNRAGQVNIPFAAHLTDDPNINTFVAKIWAKYRISTLIEWMKGEPNTSSKWKEWRDEIIRLGQTYGIVTPYTSFVDTGKKDGASGGSSGGTSGGTSGGSSGGTSGGGGSATSVEHDEIIVARDRCTIAPNPISTGTTITLDLRGMTRNDVRVEIVDLAGRVIEVLYAQDEAPELLVVRWEGLDNDGHTVSSGSYLLVVTVDGLRSTASIVVRR